MTRKKTVRKTKPAKKKAAKRKPAKPAKLFHRNCFYCNANIENDPNHECVPLTEKDLIEPLDEDLQDAFRALRRSAVEFGEQKIYNNARCVMFSRRVCYMFVRPKKAYLELTFFLPRHEKSSAIHKAMASSKTKFSHVYRITHSDQIEFPLTRWLKEAYEFSA